MLIHLHLSDNKSTFNILELLRSEPTKLPKPATLETTKVVNQTFCLNQTFSQLYLYNLNFKKLYTICINSKST